MAYQTFTLRLSGSSSTDFPLYINYNETYNAATNQSAIKITSFEGSSSLPGILYGTVYINGTKAVSVGQSISSGKISVNATTVNVAHNADGSGTFRISFGAYGSGYRDDLYVYYANKQYVCTEKSRTVALQKQTRNYTLHLSEGIGSSLLVSRGSTSLADGASIAYGDKLTVSCTPLEGYFLTNDPSGTVNVTSDVTITSAADVLSYTLTMSVGTHSTMTVSRTNSPLKGAATGQLNSGATIYYNDVLSVTCSAATGFHLTANPAGTKTVTSNITVTSAAAVDEFKLTITKDSHVTVTVKRTSSPNGGAAAGALANNATIYYGDVLNVTYSPSAGYKVVTSTSNGTKISSGANVTAKSNVVLVFATDVLAVVHICDGSEFKMYLVEIVKNGEFRLYQPHIYDGNAWKPYM